MIVLTYFDGQWLEMEAYKEWLLHGDDCTSAKCEVCPIPRNKIELSKMVERAIKSHAKDKNHCDRLALYIQSGCIKFTLVSKESAESPGASSTSTFPITSDKFLVMEDAEIRWYLKYVVTSYSFGSCDGMADLCRSMFPDSNIAEKFCLWKGKCAYFINYGIAPNFPSILVKNIKDSTFYAISLCGSLNTVIQIGQMDIVVNFWDIVVNNECTCYLDSTFIGHVRHHNLFEHFISASD